MPKELQPEKPTSKSILSKEEKDVEIPEYTDEEKDYLRNFQQRLEKAKQLRDKSFEEFDGMSLGQYWNENEKTANTQLKPKKNRSDVIYQSGTLRNKMIAFLSTLVGLNLSPEISAFNKQDIKINALGNAMEDVIDKTEELEQDEEKRMLRQYELLKHGTVFVEEIWNEKWKVVKDIVKGFLGLFREVEWIAKKEKEIGQPIKNIIPLTSVYLGDLTKYFIEDQPYIYTLQYKNYDEVKQIYEGWEMWDYVSKEIRSFSGTADDKMVFNAWRLGDAKKNQVEIIKYQDKPNNEFQIILNGVPMLPMGYPLTAINKYHEYNITQQNLEPIRQDFAYGKSFVFKNKNIVSLLDEMTKFAILKTQKSFAPPYINTGSRVISSRVFMPGKISMGIDRDVLQPLSDKESQGVTASEFNMIQELIKTVDRNTASQTFTGAKEQGGTPTATQIIELQRQARIMLGLVILSTSLLEKKLAVLRLMNIIQNWFNPLDEVVDQTRQVLKNRYRIVSRERSINGKGLGTRMVVPTETLPSKEQLRGVEEKMEKRMGMPVRIIALNPKEIKQMKYMWVVKVHPKEKKSSEISKLMFRSMISDAIALGLPLNLEHVAERFAEVWDERSDKLFMKGGMTPPVMPGEEGTTPKIKAPQMEVGRKPAGVLSE